MAVPTPAYLDLAPGLRMCRVLNGMWQVSGAHGRIDPAAALAAMRRFHDAGLTTWDLADHYGPAEDFIGLFRRQLAAERGVAALEEVQAFTKWVPHLGPMTRPIVERAVGISRQRMGVETLDPLQLHWWDYGDPRYLDALRHLADLRDAGQIRHLALTNFDTAHLEAMAQAGIRVVSNQVQYSLVDRRPAVRMTAVCQRERIGLLAYGTLCGGLLADGYLGQPEPGRAQLTTASLQKYKRMIDAWGGWELFQELLRVLHGRAEKHGVSIANVAVRAILDQPAVAGVIVGVRLGLAEHLEETRRVFDLQLDAADRAALDAVCAQGRDLMATIGDCGDEYR